MTRPDAKTLRQHTGRTERGHTRDVKIDRIGKVTIYKRGDAYWIYYREDGKSQRHRIDGNLAAAKATAAKVTVAMEENRPSPLEFNRVSPQDAVKAFLDYVENVQGLAWRTVDRYRAALDRFTEFCKASEVGSIDALDQSGVEELVRWLRGQKRARNGMSNGKKDVYKVGGIKFILSTCRTAFKWAGKRRYLPPYSENPFCQFPIDALRDPTADDDEGQIFTPEQEKAFLAALSPWQRTIFLPLITYGMRVGELTHMLIENVDFAAGTLEICSKPEMFWSVKTKRRRKLPMTAPIRELLKTLIARRTSGFVFLNEEYFAGDAEPVATFASDRDFRKHLEAVATELAEKNPAATKKDRRTTVMEFCRRMGQVPERRILAEFQKLTTQIGCPQFTRAHDLRHLFTTRAQELGANPIIVQQIVGHASLNMTRRYSHMNLDAKRGVVELIGGGVSSGGKRRPGHAKKGTGKQ